MFGGTDQSNRLLGDHNGWHIQRRHRCRLLSGKKRKSTRRIQLSRPLMRQGQVQSGMSMTLTQRPELSWTIAAARLTTVTSLSSSWQATLSKRAEQNIQPDARQRLKGGDA
ncbi:hypothetical protein K239x_15790 [Planctomycetes bacterium K23_9]|uniref:Uncharacterized protein n=1 Tax=Stieleria marina TaxID=1930275 RepID=A0A517NR73_9BACT|nr:hypothetical protein K239x_15790 [Planctomycetes bacterium K23_9]